MMFRTKLSHPSQIIRQQMLRSHVDNALRARDERQGACSPIYVVVCTDDEAGQAFARQVLKTEQRGVVGASVSYETFQSALGEVVGPAVIDRVKQRLPGQVVMVCLAEGGVTYYSPEQRVTVVMRGQRGLA